MAASKVLLEPKVHRERWDKHWDARLAEARDWFSAYGSYPGRDESSLGVFVSDCRQAYGRLYPERTSRMDDLEALPGWSWDSPVRQRWAQYARRAECWYRVHGPVDPTTKSDDPDEVRLAKWIYAQRGRYKAVPRRLTLRDVDTLEAIEHWNWVTHNPTLSRRSFLERELGWLLSQTVPVPVRSGTIRSAGTSWDCDIVITGLRTIVEVDGAWAHRHRDEQDAAKTAALQSDGWSVIRVREHPLPPLGDTCISYSVGEQTTAIANRVVRALREVSETEIDDVPASATRFLVNEAGRRGWRDVWYQRYEDLLLVLEGVPLACVVTGYRTTEGIDIGTWITTQRRRKRQGRLSGEQIRLLERIEGWDWQPKGKFTSWEDGLARLQAHVEANGCLPSSRHVCADGMTLGSWISAKRRDYKRGAVSVERRLALEASPAWSWVASRVQTSGQICPAGDLRPPSLT